jgi:hypothetical protein
MPPDTAFTEAELADIEKWAKQDLLAGNLGQQAGSRPAGGTRRRLCAFLGCD